MTRQTRVLCPPRSLGERTAEPLLRQHRSITRDNSGAPTADSGPAFRVIIHLRRSLRMQKQT